MTPIGIVLGLIEYLNRGYLNILPVFVSIESEQYERGDMYWSVLDVTKLHFMDDKWTPGDVQKGKYGRLGLCHTALGMMCMYAGSQIFLPDRQSKREREIELKREK